MKRGPKLGPRIGTVMRAQAAHVLLAAGWERKAIAQGLGCHYSTLCVILQTGINASRDPDRERQMADLWRSGKTLREIGEQFNLTRERVRQILDRDGLTRTDGGKHVAGILAQPQKDAAKREAFARRLGKHNARTRHIYGCSYDAAIECNGGLGISIERGRAHVYLRQQQSARERGIAWQLTFPQWCEIWEKSGKEALRGRGKGKFCMSRNGDVGPYSPENVRICEFVVNSKEGSELIGTYAPPRWSRTREVDSRGLTKRQAEIYDRWLAGERPVEIANACEITTTTVQMYLTIARRKVKELSA